MLDRRIYLLFFSIYHFVLLVAQKLYTPYLRLKKCTLINLKGDLNLFLLGYRYYLVKSRRCFLIYFCHLIHINTIDSTRYCTLLLLNVQIWHQTWFLSQLFTFTEKKRTVFMRTCVFSYKRVCVFDSCNKTVKRTLV